MDRTALHIRWLEVIFSWSYTPHTQTPHTPHTHTLHPPHTDNTHTQSQGCLRVYRQHLPVPRTLITERTWRFK